MSTKGDIIVVSRLGIIKAWLVSNGQPLFEIRGHDELAPISFCEYKQEEVLAVYRSNNVLLIELENGEILKTYVTATSKYVNRSSKIFLSSLGGVCMVVHKNEVSETEEHSLLVEVFHISSQDKHEIFHLKTENDIMSLDVVVSNQILVTYVGLGEDLDKTRKPTFRPSVASSWQKMSLELWDMKAMKPTSQLTTADDSVRCSCVTPRRDEVIMLCNMSFIETASEYVCFVKIYSVPDRKSFQLPLSFPSGIVSMCGLGFTCIISASADKIIRVWDLERSIDFESRTQEQGDSPNDTGRVLNGEVKTVVNGVKGGSLNDRAVTSTSFDESSKDVEPNTQEVKVENSNSAVDSSDVSHEVKCDKTNSLSELNKVQQSSSLAHNDETRKRLRNSWKKVTSFPVGKKFLKLRHSTLSSALQSYDIDSGKTLEDLQVIYCHKDMIVYLARRMVDSVYGVVAWNLSTDVKMRISELQNPDACIVKADLVDYLVIVSSSIISVYNCTTGEFVRCKEINVDIHGSDRLSSLTKGRILITEADRRSLKVLSVPRLDVVNSISYEDNVLIMR